MAAGGGSSAGGGPTSPRAVAPSATAPRDPGRRHLSQDGSRAGTCGARAAGGTRKRARGARGAHGSRWAPGSPAESDPTMALEQGLGSSSPQSSQLLDAVLQNLYDFGECGASAPAWRADLRSRGSAARHEVGGPPLSG